MKVKFVDNIYLESDDTQYMIRKYTGKIDNKTGEETTKILGYYGKIEEAFKKLLDLKIARSDATTMEELVKDIKEAKAYIKELLGELS